MFFGGCGDELYKCFCFWDCSFVVGVGLGCLIGVVGSFEKWLGCDGIGISVDGVGFNYLIWVG